MLVDPVTMPPVWQRFSARDIDIQGKAPVFCSLVQGDKHMRFQPQPPVPLRYQLNISLPVQNFPCFGAVTLNFRGVPVQMQA